ncbi:MAG: efflux RND transporter periplasmic adaptor subunit [Flavobacteriales bacterium]
MSIKLNLLFFATLLICVTSCKKKNQLETTPTRQDITESVYSSVTIQPDSLYSVYSIATGILEKVLVEEGDTVVIGQNIFQITNNNPKLSSDNARLSMEIAKSNYSGQHAVLEDLKSEIKLAELRFKNDSLNFQRQQNLWNQKIGSQAEFDTKKLVFETSQQNLKTLKNKFLRTENELKQQVQQATNNYESTLFLSKDYTIQSKINGRVYSIFKNAGEIVSAQQPIAMIGSQTKFIAELLVDEVDIVRVSLNQSVLITLDAYKETVFEAQITKIFPQKNDRSQTFKVEAEFLKNPTALYSGLSGEANIIISTKKNALVIPKVYLNKDQTVKTNNGMIKIETGFENLDQIEVLSGIDENTIIYLPEE